MNKLLVALGLLLTTLFMTACEESTQINRANAAIVKVTTTTQVMTMVGPANRKGICTGFTIAPDLVLTADHCLGDNLLADGKPATLLHGDHYYDLAVLKVPGLEKPSLEFRDTPVMYNEDLVAIGYGNGYNVTLPLHVRVVVPSVRIGADEPTGIIMQGGFIQGMSGGPIIDGNGLVVSVVQKGVAAIAGYGVNMTMIKAFLEDSGLTPQIGASSWPN